MCDLNLGGKEITNKGYEAYLTNVVDIILTGNYVEEMELLKTTGQGI